MMDAKEIAPLFEDREFNPEKLDIPGPTESIMKDEDPATIKVLTCSADIERIEQAIALKRMSGFNILYRGHESKEYKIESSLVREVRKSKIELTVDNLVKAEHKALDCLKEQLPYQNWNNYMPPQGNSDLYLLGIGRHLGLPCRLIDYTNDIETAVWFAVMDPRHYNKDGELIIMLFEHDQCTREGVSPFDTKGLTVFNGAFFLKDSFSDLPLGDQRRFVQYGRFMFADNESLLNEQELVEHTAAKIYRILIPQYAKLTLAAELYRDVYSGCAFQAQIDCVKREMINNLVETI